MATELASFTCRFEQQRGATAPAVSVIMAAYNGERFLRPAIDSILSQSFRDFELIVIDDCSTDSTSRIMSEVKDERIRVLRNERNLGIAGTLNRGLAVARGEYIALQDHDDVSLPTRFEKQVQHLHAHPEVGLVGSPAWVIDENDRRNGQWRVPFDDIELKWQLLLSEPFLHTAIMLRRRVVEDVGDYSIDPQYRFAEDYEFISRIAGAYPVANLREPLVAWREHCHSASELNRAQQEKAAFEISLRNIRILCPGADATVRRCIQVLLQSKIGDDVNITADEAGGAVAFLESLLGFFYRKYHFPEKSARAHRRRIQWIFGKHLVALAYRRNGRRDLACRVRLLACGTKLLSRTVGRVPARSDAGNLY
jgi:glycosyltransferase involved in cell wall biosynthesis